MSVKIKAIVKEEHRVEVEHGPSKNKILTDPPVDNGGKGADFSPTDLFTSALASCILTIMSMAATKNNLNLQGACIELEKHMQENPRRIGKFIGTLTFPPGLDEKAKERLKAFINACPVHKSIHPDIKLELEIK
ncbi:OsmC family protein [Elusimicrobiota bacterium]